MEGLDMGRSSRRGGPTANHSSHAIVALGIQARDRGSGVQKIRRLAGELPRLLTFRLVRQAASE